MGWYHGQMRLDRGWTGFVLAFFRGTTLIVAGCGGGPSATDDAVPRDAAMLEARADHARDGAVLPSEAGQPIDGGRPEVGPEAGAEVMVEAGPMAIVDAGDADADARGDTPRDSSGDAAPNAFAGSRWVSLQAPLGATIKTLAIDNAGVVYAGSSEDFVEIPGGSSGIFMSRDDGVSWTPVNRGLDELNIAVVAAAGSTLFAGTTGLFRSADHGATWVNVIPGSLGSRMSVIGAGGDLVFVAKEDGGDSYRWSQDGGLTFKQSPYAASVDDIAVLGDVVLMAGRDGMTRSMDRGVTFTRVTSIKIDMTRLRCDGVSTCYTHATAASNGLRGFFKSSDAGQTWTPLSKSILGLRAVSANGTVFVRPTPAGGSATLARSDDGGTTWVDLPGPLGADSRPLSCLPDVAVKGTKVFMGCSNGVHRSDDAGATWTAATGSRATGAITGPWGKLAVDRSAAAVSASGDLYLSDRWKGLLRSHDDGKQWEAVTAPSWEGCITTAKGTLICANPKLLQVGLSRSTDRGATWNHIHVNRSGPPLNRDVTVELLATHGATVYATYYQGIARSDDDGVTFKALPRGLDSSVDALQVLRNGHLLALTFARELHRSVDQGATWKKLEQALPLPVGETSGGRLFAAWGGCILSSTNEGDQWVVDCAKAPPVSFDRPKIGVDGSDRLFVIAWRVQPANSMFRERIVYGSADQGESWHALPDLLPHPYISQFTTDKQGRLLVGTNGGMYRLER